MIAIAHTRAIIVLRIKPAEWVPFNQVSGESRHT